jgi:hypothetical protein
MEPLLPEGRLHVADTVVGSRETPVLRDSTIRTTAPSGSRNRRLLSTNDHAYRTIRRSSQKWVPAMAGRTTLSPDGLRESDETRESKA